MATVTAGTGLLMALALSAPLCVGVGEVQFDGNIPKEGCRPDFFLDVYPAGKLVEVQTTPPKALGMCDVQHGHCSCPAWPLQPQQGMLEEVAGL